MSVSEASNHKFPPLYILNRSSKAITLYLEPWGENHFLPPGERYVIEAYGRQSGSGFEVEYHDEALIVMAWKGSTVRLFFKGEEVGTIEQRPVVPDFM